MCLKFSEISNNFEKVAKIISGVSKIGIAILSLILKVFANSILLLFGSLLSNDDLQFGCQWGCSTVQCTWAVQETVSYYLRNNSEVFCCLLDFSKAFDKVNFGSLFQKLLDRNFPAIFLWLITYIYNHQLCFIRGKSTESSRRMESGRVQSPSLF